MRVAIGYLAGALVCGALAAGFAIVGLAAATGEDCDPNCGGWAAGVAGLGVIVSLVLAAAWCGLALHRLRRHRAD